MLNSRRKLILSLALVVIVVVAGSVATTAWSAEDAELGVDLTAVASEFRHTYSITVKNDSARDVGNIYVAGRIPEGANFVEAPATPAGASFMGRQGGEVAWLVPQVAAGKKVGPFSYKVSVSGRTAGPAIGFASWKEPGEGSALSKEVAFSEVVIDGPKRGCTACHVLRDEKTGSVTIAYEAMLRGGPNHPKLAFDTTVDQCLQCHKPGTGERENMGVVAPKMLRDIVHPVHLNSPAFTGTYKGNCFTCHNVDGAGRFVLLGEKVKTDFRGIPSSSPIKGILPSELGR